MSLPKYWFEYVGGTFRVKPKYVKEYLNYPSNDLILTEEERQDLLDLIKRQKP